MIKGSLTLADYTKDRVIEKPPFGCKPTSKQLPYETFPCSIRRVWDTTTIEGGLGEVAGSA